MTVNNTHDTLKALLGRNSERIKGILIVIVATELMVPGTAAA